jgi:hypothetical protein
MQSTYVSRICVIGYIAFGSISLSPVDQLSDLSVSSRYHQRGPEGKPLTQSQIPTSPHRSSK